MCIGDAPFLPSHALHGEKWWYVFPVRDKAPVTGEYACVRCFYDHFRLQKKAVNKDANFPGCELCKNGLWIRISEVIQEEMFEAGDIEAQAEPGGDANVIVIPVLRPTQE
jgi:hypothetical protein